MSVVHFETTREGNLIRIPEQYIDRISDRLAVTLVDAEEPMMKPKKRQLGSLQDRGSVTFENDFYMSSMDFWDNQYDEVWESPSLTVI
jgi:hypothetical protein